MEANLFFKLNNGIKIPALGFGTWQIPDGKITFDAVSSALKNGYRHIDTAHSYGNEKSVGQAVRSSGISRSELFITSKLPAYIKTYKETLESFDKTIKNLELDYLDLYLIHSPHPWDRRWEDFTKQNIEVWKAMEEIYKSGQCRAIGVSNFKVSDLTAILNNCEIIPMVNQIKYFIGNTQKEISQFCNKNNILIEGYSPLATGAILNNKKIATIAEKYQVSIAKICIRYVLQRAVIPISKSTHPERIKQNIELNFEITDTDMNYLDKLKNTVKTMVGLNTLKKVYHLLRSIIKKLSR